MSYLYGVTGTQIHRGDYPMVLTLHAPQLIYLALTAVGLVQLKDREPLGAAASLIATAVCLGLLWWGGFFG